MKKFFRFNVNNIPIFNAFIAIVRSHNYDTDELSNIPDKVIANGITIMGTRDGSLMYSVCRDITMCFTRLDDLIIHLCSIGTSDLASTAIKKLASAPNAGITREEFQALLDKIPEFKAYLESHYR